MSKVQSYLHPRVTVFAINSKLFSLTCVVLKFTFKWMIWSCFHLKMYDTILFSLLNVWYDLVFTFKCMIRSCFHFKMYNTILFSPYHCYWPNFCEPVHFWVHRWLLASEERMIWLVKIIIIHMISMSMIIFMLRKPCSRIPCSFRLSSTWSLWSLGPMPPYGRRT